MMENNGSVAKKIKIKIADGINILMGHKSIDCLGHFKSHMLKKCTCVHVCMFIYTCTYGQTTYICTKT